MCTLGITGILSDCFALTSILKEQGAEPSGGSLANEDTPHLGVNVPALVTTPHSSTAAVCFHGVLHDIPLNLPQF